MSFWCIMISIAVIYFPGINCEDETQQALEAVGMHADILRWNTDYKLLKKYDGYVISGGWSYEDRIRAGVISSRDPIMDVFKAEVKKGKPLLGICNGAQVLIESGLIPGITTRVEMGLAPNNNPKISGYYCTWVQVLCSAEKKNAFNLTTEKDERWQIPIAHGEGRFTTNEKHLLRDLLEHDQITFRYCDNHGNIIEDFPINPNGSLYNIAAVCNPQGNVMAMMPHPERASWLRQLPEHKGTFETLEKAAPARKIFESMKKYIEKRS